MVAAKIRNVQADLVLQGAGGGGKCGSVEVWKEAQNSRAIA